MGSKNGPLHIFLLPFLAHGHIIPTVDMAKLFAARGVKATIITTPLNAPCISKAIGKAKTHNSPVPVPIHIQTIEFPYEESGIPKGCENVDAIPSPNLAPGFVKATRLLQRPLEQLLLEQRPDCLVADMFFPWANDSASKFGIPRLVFHGTCFFSLCASECIRLYEAEMNASCETESFVVPNLPGQIRLAKTQLPDFSKNKEMAVLAKLLDEAKEADAKSYGVVVNSFCELEHVYADHYRKVLGRKAWHIGPLSLCNRNAQEKAQRGKDASIDERECLKWLDSKKRNSVIYVCFGSVTNFPDSQLRDIALGLEASGHYFIWVVRRSKKDGEEWLPEGFEESMKEKGLIIRGWAPQVLILEHEAIGAFVTHCGWNSTLEAVTAGVPMVTWPIAAEQFFNEKLVTQVLKIGVPVGVKKWVRLVGDTITRDSVEKAVTRIMVGEEAEEMRTKAKVLAQMARKAVEVGGSSYSDLDALIKDLVNYQYTQ